MSIHRIAKAIFFALLLSVAIASFVQPRPKMLAAGDYPGFYSLAVLAHEAPEKLYDRAAQSEIQTRAWPEREGFYYTVYPPYTALLLSPLAQLSPATGKVLFCGLMILGFMLGLSTLRSLKGDIGQNAVTAALLAMSSVPVFASVVAAQNSGLSFLFAALFLAVLWPGAHRYPRSELLAGLVVALWTFKPQYALFAIAFLVGRKSLVAAVGALPIGVGYYGLAYYLLGRDWLVEWVSAANAFGAENYVANGHQMTSVAAVIAWFWGSELAIVAQPFLIAAGLSVALLLGFLSRRHGAWPGLYFVALLPMLSPQTLFYDLSIALPALLVGVPWDRRSAWYLCGWSALSWAAFFIRSPGGFPIFFLLVLLLAFPLYRWHGRPMSER